MRETYTPAELRRKAGEVELFIEMDATLTLIAELAERAPDGRVEAETVFGEFTPRKMWWTTAEAVPVEAGRLAGPLDVLEAAFDCRAAIVNPEETDLWNQCYRVAAELLAHLERIDLDVVSDPRVVEGVYRTVDGDVPHFWVEADVAGITHVLETHAHASFSAWGDRGGVHVAPERPEKYVQTGGVYHSQDLQNGGGPTGSPIAEKVGRIHRDALANSETDFRRA